MALPRVRAVDALADRAVRRHGQPRRLVKQRLVARRRLVIDAGNRRARQDVVELVEQQLLPDLLQFAVRVARAGDDRGQRGRQFQLAQRDLDFAVIPLDLALRGIGALVALQVELARPGRIARGVLGDVREKRGRRLLHDRAQPGQVGFARQPFEVLLARPAAAVADAEQHQRLVGDPLFQEVLLDRQHRAGGGGAVVGRLRRQMCQHLRAVDPLPPEGVVGVPGDPAPRQFLGHKIGHAGLRQELRQRPRIAEHIRHPQAVGIPPELLAEEPLAVKDLADQRFAGRQVGVGLDPHRALDFPPSLGDAPLDCGIKLRVVPLYPLVLLRLTGAEDVVRVALHHAQHGGEGAAAFADRLADRP